MSSVRQGAAILNMPLYHVPSSSSDYSSSSTENEYSSEDFSVEDQSQQAPPTEDAVPHEKPCNRYLTLLENGRYGEEKT
mgnify:CR=1 FL=1